MVELPRWMTAAVRGDYPPDQVPLYDLVETEGKYKDEWEEACRQRGADIAQYDYPADGDLWPQVREAAIGLVPDDSYARWSLFTSLELWKHEGYEEAVILAQRNPDRTIIPFHCLWVRAIELVYEGTSRDIALLVENTEKVYGPYPDLTEEELEEEERKQRQYEIDVWEGRIVEED